MLVKELIEILKGEHPKARVNVVVEYGMGCWEKATTVNVSSDGKGKNRTVTLSGDSVENDNGGVGGS